MTAAEGRPDASAGQAPGAAGQPAVPTRPRRVLSLGDPVSGSATEDRPESWGDHTESDADRLAHYEAQRPPHHGG